MLKRFLLSVLVTLAIVGVAQLSFGAIQGIGNASSNLFTNTINQVHDHDAEVLIKGANNSRAGVVEKGDFLMGMLSFDNIKNYNNLSQEVTLPTNTSSWLTGVFLLQVANKTSTAIAPSFPFPGGTAYTFQLAPASAADWILNVGFAPQGLNTEAIVYDASSLAWNTEAGGTFKSAIATAVGSKLWEFGAGVGVNVPGAAPTGTPFWIANTFTDVISSVNQGGPAGQLPSFVVGANVTYRAAGQKLAAIDAAPFGATYQLEVTGGFNPKGASQWDVQSGCNAYLAPVPEPVSAAVWFGMLVGAVSIFAVRRRGRSHE